MHLYRQKAKVEDGHNNYTYLQNDKVSKFIINIKQSCGNKKYYIFFIRMK